VNVPPGRDEHLERERRWRVPAGVAAIFGAIAFQAGLIIGAGALEGDGTAERLLEASKGDADGQLQLGVLVSAIGFLALAIPLTYLFLAARARSERVLRQLIGVSLVGAVMVSGGIVLNNSAYLDAAENFAASEAQRGAEAADKGATEAPKGEADGPNKQRADRQGEQRAGETTVEATTTSAQPSDEAAEVESAEDAEEAADDRAEDALADASGAAASALLVRGGALLFAIGFFYTSLWCMRVGLLSRFWGSLGMASAVVLALFFLYFFGLVWFLAVGLMLLGAWLGGRPPAWEAGIAIPWTKPGEQLPRVDSDTVEGHGRELSEGELPEDEPSQDPSDPRDPPQKRKRRR